MGPTSRAQRYTKFLVYVVAVVLINIVGTTLFLRIDLTRNNKYSLSEASQGVLANISDPLTIKVFFTRDLPAPHNTTERYLHDLLEEYALYADEQFNYQFYDVTPEGGEERPQVTANQETARDYGVYPVQVQSIDADEVQFKQAFMGMVIIHGDLMEQIPTIDSTEGLEYRITTSIRKLADKISTFASLKDKVRVNLVLSSSLFQVAPYMGIDNLAELPDTMQTIVEELNDTLSGRIEFSTIDPSQEEMPEAVASALSLVRLRWPDIPQRSGESIPAGEGLAGMVLQYDGKVDSMPGLNVVDIPIFGTQYSLLQADEIKELLNEKIEAIVGINDDIGYLADHGTLDALTSNSFPRQQQSPEESIMNFRLQVDKNYSLNTVTLDDKSGLTDAFKCLIIARPTEKFSDYDLFQIDQFLMRGNNLALFLDRFQETYPGGQPSPYAQPQYTPIDVGLKKLLAHYGVQVEPSIVMDEACFKQRVGSRMGGGERPIYFAPIIKSEFINNAPAFMTNINGLVAMKASPVTLLTDVLEKNGLTGTTLFSSSAQSWIQAGRVSFNPVFTQPPGPDEERKSFPLACMIEGEFPSYFAGKPVPVKATAEVDADDDRDINSAGEAAAGEAIEARDRVITQGRPARIFVTGSSQMLRDHMFDQEARHPNGIFIMNLLDTLNDRDRIAVLRSKQQAYNPLRTLPAATKAAIKWFNIVGLPALAVVFGLIVWIFRINKKRRLRMMFAR